MTAANHGPSAFDDDLIQIGLDLIDQGITIFDRDLTLVFVNQTLREMIDLPRHVACRGASFEDIIRYNAERGEYGIGDVDAMVRERVTLARQFTPHTIERTRGNNRVLRISGRPLAKGGFATVYTDITQQRRHELSLERRLQQRVAELRRNEDRFTVIANELPAGIAYIDQHDCVRYANFRFAKAYDLTPDTIEGQSLTQVFPPETIEKVADFFARAQRGISLDFDETVVLRDGRHLEVRTFLRPDPSGSGFYLLSVNVSKHKHATALLQQAQKMDALGQLSSGIAHDFNNLLTVLLGNLVPLQSHLPADLNEDYLAPALRAARRGADLTKRLLGIARRQPLSPVPVDLEEVVQNLVEMVGRTLPDGINLSFAPSGIPIWAYADRALLETAILNLTINARDAITGTGEISIALSPRFLNEQKAGELTLAAGDYVEISVADTGAGIPDDLITRVFDPFFSTKSDGQGTGLGLALAHSFVTQSSGHIRIRNKSGYGAIVEILLPASGPPPALGAGPLDDTADGLDGRLILLVEDDESVRIVVRRQLVALGLQVIEAETADAAVELIDNIDQIAFILSDISLPGTLDGLTLRDQLAQTRPALPVILMTGEGRRSKTTPGDTQILAKPFDQAGLHAALIQAMALCAATVEVI